MTKHTLSNKLELKIPPDIVFAICMGILWGFSILFPLFKFTFFLRIPLIILFLVAGIMLVFIAGFKFSQSKTSVNPIQPEKASALVTTGIYHFTRNPMYLGMAFILMAQAFLVANYSAFFGVVLFVVYITRFQIKPEEQILEEKFGSNYLLYKQKVRRWL